MKREIKFRVWHYDIGMCEPSDIWELTTFKYDNGDGKKTTEASFQKDKCTFMQNTGLKDKNGNEIYEGDIVSTYRRVGRGYREMPLDTVHYSCITAKWYPEHIVVTEMCEIIGNIYENPELLK